eukprot:GHVL01000725.1.p1 GENE.GHVL01000725.1~~GHVL01000725.1.p1  ORF type:complete len:419 (-),score=62.52 GHVL01000725.1:694-1950(-)
MSELRIENPSFFTSDSSKASNVCDAIRELDSVNGVSDELLSDLYIAFKEWAYLWRCLGDSYSAKFCELQQKIALMSESENLSCLTRLLRHSIVSQDQEICELHRRKATKLTASLKGKRVIELLTRIIESARAYRKSCQNVSTCISTGGRGGAFNSGKGAIFTDSKNNILNGIEYGVSTATKVGVVQNHKVSSDLTRSPVMSSSGSFDLSQYSPLLPSTMKNNTLLAKHSPKVSSSSRKSPFVSVNTLSDNLFSKKTESAWSDDWRRRDVSTSPPGWLKAAESKKSPNAKSPQISSNSSTNLSEWSVIKSTSRPNLNSKQVSPKPFTPIKIHSPPANEVVKDSKLSSCALSSKTDSKKQSIGDWSELLDSTIDKKTRLSIRQSKHECAHVERISANRSKEPSLAQRKKKVLEKKKKKLI